MAGRRNLYESHVSPFFDRIDKMLNDGASEAQVAEALDISYTTWNKYKVKYKDLRELCEKPRTKLVDELRSALVKRALGCKVKEKKTYIRKGEDGNETKYTEITVKELPPDTTALFGALNLYDPEYVRDKKQYELKQQELEVRRMQAESKDW